MQLTAELNSLRRSNKILQQEVRNPYIKITSYTTYTTRDAMLYYE